MRHISTIVFFIALTGCGSETPNNGVPDLGMGTMDSSNDLQTNDLSSNVDTSAADTNVLSSGDFVRGTSLPLTDTGEGFALLRSETFPNAKCMDGSDAGISVRLNPGATRLVINFQGGGLCIDPTTCAGVRNRNGFTTEEGNNQIVTEAASIMNRADAENPAADFHHVFVHYCSGDVHAGNNPNGFDGTMNLGRANTEAFLSRIAPTFDQGEHEVDMVLLSGSSAGAMSVLMNYPLVQEAFGDIPVHAFIDAAPPSSNLIFRPCEQTNWHDSLGFKASQHPGCDDCGLNENGIEAILTHLVDTYPDRRFGWFSATEDAVLRCLHQLPGGTCEATTVTGTDFSVGLVEMRERLRSRSNFKTYFYPSNLHTAMFYLPQVFPMPSFGNFSTKGVSLSKWLEDLIAGNATWDHVDGETEPLENTITGVCE